MGCNLLDFGCHIQNAAWEWWANVGLLNKVLIIGGIVLLILAALRGVLSLIHRIGGWPAVVGAVLAVLGVVLALLPRKPKGRLEPDYEDGGDQPIRKPVRRTAKRTPATKRKPPNDPPAESLSGS